MKGCMEDVKNRKRDYGAERSIRISELGKEDRRIR